MQINMHRVTKITTTKSGQRTHERDGSTYYVTQLCVHAEGEAVKLVLFSKEPLLIGTATPEENTIVF